MAKDDGYSYVGGELGLFAHAQNWKRYWSSKIRPYLSGDVLEVGAGIGVNTAILRPGLSGQWTCLEPDRDLVRQLESSLSAGGLTPSCRIVTGTLSALPQGETFDTILYVDVLEHIEADETELTEAAKRLRPNGRVIVLSPAHQWLFSEFDRSIGHCRRYSRRTLLRAAPSSLSLVKCFYLDACGLFASLANRTLLRQSLPTAQQILCWDRIFVPVSRIVDPLFAFRVGKSIVGIWKPAASASRPDGTFR